MNHAFRVIEFEHGDVEMIVVVRDERENKELWSFQAVLFVDFFEQGTEPTERFPCRAPTGTTDGEPSSMKPLELGRAFEGSCLGSRKWMSRNPEFGKHGLQIRQLCTPLRILHPRKEDQRHRKAGECESPIGHKHNVWQFVCCMRESIDDHMLKCSFDGLVLSRDLGLVDVMLDVNIGILAMLHIQNLECGGFDTDAYHAIM
jgi:hypothetical protein